MAAPTLQFLGNPVIQTTNAGSSVSNAILGTSKTFLLANLFIREIHSTGDAVFTAPTKPLVSLSPGFTSQFIYDRGFQYDVRTNTLITSNQGIVTEFDMNGNILRQVDWVLPLGTSIYQGVVLGYEGETHFYIVDRGANIVYKCPRDFSSQPTVAVTGFGISVHYASQWSPNGFFNGTHIYLPKVVSGSLRILRTDVANKNVTEIQLTTSSAISNTTNHFMLGFYQNRTVFTYGGHNVTTNAPLHIYDIDDFQPIRFLIEDGDEVKSYSDTGYTKNLCVGGAVISSSGWEAGHPNSDAFDTNMDTFWGSNETGLNVRGNAFIGYDFEEIPRHIRRIEITKAADPTNTPRYIKVQQSLDGATWVDTMPTITLTPDSGTQVIDIPTTNVARRWRLLAFDPLETGKRWRVRDIKMYERILTGWYTVGLRPPSREMFLVNGLGSIDFMTHDIMRYLDNDKFKIHGYIEQPRQNDPAVIMDAVPHPRVIYPKEDISLHSIYNIDKFTITGIETGQGVVRVILSIDKGVTWMTWDTITDTWRYIDNTSMIEVRGAGMTIDTFNARTTEDWMSFGTKEIRFAYYLEQVEQTDGAATSLVTMQADMLGVWEKAKEKDYSYGYANDNRLSIEFYTDGSYKVNYNAELDTSSAEISLYSNEF